MRILTAALVIAGCAWGFSPALAATSSPNMDDACPPGQVQGDDGLCIQTKGARMGFDPVADAGTTPKTTADTTPSSTVQPATPTAAKAKSAHHKTTKTQPSAKS